MVKAQSVRCCCSSCTSRVVGVGVGAAAAVGVGGCRWGADWDVCHMHVGPDKATLVCNPGGRSQPCGCDCDDLPTDRLPTMAILRCFCCGPMATTSDGYVWLALGQVLFGSTKQKTRSRRTRISVVVVGAPQCSSSEMLEIIEFYAGSCPCGLS